MTREYISYNNRVLTICSCLCGFLKTDRLSVILVHPANAIHLLSEFRQASHFPLLRVKATLGHFILIDDPLPLRILAKGLGKDMS